MSPGRLPQQLMQIDRARLDLAQAGAPWAMLPGLEIAGQDAQIVAAQVEADDLAMREQIVEQPAAGTAVPMHEPIPIRPGHGDLEAGDVQVGQSQTETAAELEIED